MLDPDFSLTACIVSKCPHRGQRPHPEATMHKRGGGLCGSMPRLESGRGSQLVHKGRGGGAPGYEEGGGAEHVA